MYWPGINLMYVCVTDISLILLLSKEGKPRSSTSPAAGGATSPADAKKETLTIDDFDLLKVVGKGAFGKVRSTFSASQRRREEV